MNNKITFPELVEALTVVTNSTKRNSESFLKEMFAVIAETLIEGEPVKIKKLGTFKVALVEARKSVNVNTGEEIDIPAHKKIVFAPDKELAEAINMPFDNFETVELDEDVPLDELAKLNGESHNSKVKKEKEIVVPPIPVIPAVESVKEEKEEAENPGDNISETIEKKDENEIIDENEITHVVEEENSNMPTEPEQPNQESVPEVEQKNENVEQSAQESVVNEETPKEVATDAHETQSNNITQASFGMDVVEHQGNEVKKKHFSLGFFWGCISGIFVSFAIVFFVGQMNGFPIVIYSDTKQQDEGTPVDTLSPEAKAAIMEIEKEVAAMEFDNKTTDANQPSNEKTSVVGVETNKTTMTPEPTVPQKQISPQSPKIDTIAKNRYLTTMAREYYGNFNFWVYIYEENKSKLGNPSTLSPGTKVVIPSASKYGIDANDSKSVEKARQKAAEILKRYE